MEYEAIQQEQKKILARIYNSPQTTETRKVTGILQALRECTFEDVTFLGECGVRLWNFGRSIDLAKPHPDLFLLPGSLAEWNSGTLNHLACDLVKLSKTNLVTSPDLVRALRKTFDNAIHAAFLEFWVKGRGTGIAKAQAQEEGWILQLVRVIDDPAANLLYIRFVSDRQRRDEIRIKKIAQQIDLCISDWDIIPADFRGYYRGTTVFEADIVKAEVRKNHFLKFGLQAMAQEVQNSIDMMRSEVSHSQYCGFNRITLRMAASILGKLCGYGERLSVVEYQPLCCPLAKVIDTPEAIKLVVDFLEEYPELSRCSAFDNYWVLMPEALGPILGSNICVLLGERDGEHFFICYWM